MLRPRYHFAGSEAMAWARTPYQSQSALHATRFVALGPVIMEKGEKFLHALKLSPMAEMSAAELQAINDKVRRARLHRAQGSLVAISHLTCVRTWPGCGGWHGDGSTALT